MTAAQRKPGETAPAHPQSASQGDGGGGGLTLPSATELLLTWDAARPRSQQAELGMSALGGCRRRAGYTLAGTPPEKAGGGVQAILGTAVHQVLIEALRPLVPGNSILDDEAVHFAGITGHPDIYVEPILVDIKTVGYSTQLDTIRDRGPHRSHRWQAHTYAAALILAGRRVTTVQIDYLARDSGEEYLFGEPFSLETVREAMAWLANVRDTELEFLPRDYRPGSAFCDSCPFRGPCWQGADENRDERSVLYREDPDAAAWAARLLAAQQARKQAEALERDAKGALDALRPNTLAGTTADVAVPGLDGRVLRFTVKRPSRRPDTERIKADYARVGAEMPILTGDPVVQLSVAKPKRPKTPPAAHKAHDGHAVDGGGGTGAAQKEGP